jgi:hypothetical protein
VNSNQVSGIPKDQRMKRRQQQKENKTFAPREWHPHNLIGWLTQKHNLVSNLNLVLAHFHRC